MGENKNKSAVKKYIGRFMKRQESSIILAVLVYVIFVTVVNPTFLSADNIFNVLRATGFTLITVVGMTLCLSQEGWIYQSVLCLH